MGSRPPKKHTDIDIYPPLCMEGKLHSRKGVESPCVGLSTVARTRRKYGPVIRSPSPYRSVCITLATVTGHGSESPVISRICTAVYGRHTVLTDRVDFGLVGLYYVAVCICIIVYSSQII